MEEENKKQKLYQRPWLQSLAAIVIIFGALAGFIYWQSTKNTVFIENSYLDAPMTDIAPFSAGILNSLYVKEGDTVSANSPVALVGTETLFSKDAGIVASAPKILGAYYSPGETVVTVVANQEMRVVGSIDETKGLSQIKARQRASFTVDAFPGKKYEGMVEEISPNSNDTGVVFSISDKRPVKKFNVYVDFNINDYPELKSGMSAKVTVYTK